MSAIEWTDETWNPVVGCSPVSPGCLNCYAATMAPRLAAMGQPEYVGLTVKRKGSIKAMGPEDATLPALGKVSRYVFNGTVRCLPERLTAPLHWRRARMVFVNSMSDLFHEAVPFDFIDQVFAVMALCPQHTFQILTKRPERMAAYLFRETRVGDHLNSTSKMITLAALKIVFDLKSENPHSSVGSGVKANPDCSLVAWPLPNVWLGTSVENQKCADERIPWLLKCPAAVRFLSCEPLLGPVDLCIGYGSIQHMGGHQQNVFYDCLKDYEKHPGVHWVIAGGESGAKSKIRWCNVEWIRGIVTQCHAAKVPVFVKQLGTSPIARYAEACGSVIRPQLAPEFMPMKLKSKKGSNPKEWSKDLRVREMPPRFKAVKG